mmetsp:Transcript_16770/g.24832  ORF Transcript_16770/g.24832 Transcript_16770/m.24832 type:complete len:88 (+) Transcript_16770:502-765(+)
MLKEAINMQSVANVGIAGHCNSNAKPNSARLIVESTALVMNKGFLPMLSKRDMAISSPPSLKQPTKHVPSNKAPLEVIPASASTVGL